MKNTRKTLAVLLSVVLVLALAAPAMAADPKAEIVIENSVKDETYTAVKIFDLTYDPADDSKVSYTFTKTAANEALFAIVNNSAYFTLTETAAAGVYSVTLADDSVTGEAIGAYLYGELVKDDGSLDTAIVTAAKTGTGTGAKLTLDVSGSGFGYYLVLSSKGAVVSVSSTEPTAKVIDKNVIPDAEKVIDIGDGVNANTAKVGDTVPFKITVHALNYNGSKAITNYYIEDTATNFTFTGTLKVTVNGTELAGTAYTSTFAADGSTFLVTIPWQDSDGGFLYPASCDIVLTYSAVLKDTAGENAVTVNYTDTEVTTPPTTPPVTPPPTKTYTFDLNLSKVDEDSNALAGAKFALYVQNGTVWTLISEAGDGISDTAFAWSGLNDGKYKLVETKTPDGFIPMADKEFTVTTTLDDASGVRTKIEVSDDAFIPEADSTTGEYTGKVNVTIENVQGTALPQTGGVGTTLFILFGALAVTLAGVFLVTNQRMRKEGY